MINAAHVFKATAFLTGVAGFLLASSDGPFFPYVNILGACMMAGAFILTREIKS